LLYNFSFQRTAGSGPVSRTIKDTMLHLGQPQISEGPTLINYFDTDLNPHYWFGDGDLVFDPIQQRLIIDNSYYLLITTRTGVPLSSPTSGSNGVHYSATIGHGDGIALEGDDNTLIFDYKTNGWNHDYIYTLALSSNTFTGPLYDLDTTDSNVNTGSGGGLVFDPKTPSDFYILVTNTAFTAARIDAINISTGALASDISPNSWSLPSALANGGYGNSIGMTIDPVTGDFYVGVNVANKDERIWHIVRSTPTTDDHFDIMLSGSATSYSSSTIPSTSTGTGNFFGLAYDPTTNHLFVGDSSMQRVFEILPPRFMSPPTSTDSG
jgi:hypothetical protein